LEIERKVRAFNPFPIAETRLDGEQLRIYAAEALQGYERDSPGGGAACSKSSDDGRVGAGASGADVRSGDASRGTAGNAVELRFPSDTAEAGRVVELRSDAIIVACGSGRLALKELQRPGKKPVAARDLMNTLNLAGRRLG
jgi:methionyl-tRNA formyltransferase